MSMTVGIIGILVGLVVMNFLIYKGLNIVLTAVISSFIIMLTSGLSIQDTWTSSMESVGSTMATLVPVIIFGAVLGVIYTKSGAAVSLADLLMKPVRKTTNKNLKRLGCIIMFLILRMLIGLAGIDSMAIMYTMLAIAAAMFSECDLPRKYVNCIMMVGGTICTLMPGVPSQILILFEELMGFDNSGNLLFRFLMMLLYTALCVVVLNFNMAKDQAKGEHFEKGPLTFPEENEKTPHWLATLVPLVAVYVTYNFMGLDSWSSLLLGIILAIVLFGAYIPVPEGKKRFGYLVDVCNSGVFMVPVAILMNMLPGFVMEASPAYNYLVELMSELPIPSAFGLLIISTIIVGLAASASPVLISSIAVSTFIPAGLSIQACAVIGIYASTILDTLPNSLGIITQCHIIDIPMKEAYPSIFKTTVLATAGMSILVTVFVMLGAL